jgi:hypothetical protein
MDREAQRLKSSVRLISGYDDVTVTTTITVSRTEHPRFTQEQLLERVPNPPPDAGYVLTRIDDDPDDLLVHFDSYLAIALALRAQERIFQSRRVLRLLSSGLDALRTSLDSRSPLRALWREVQGRFAENSEVKRILAESEDVDALLKAIRSKDGWTISKESKTGCSAYRYDGTFVTIRTMGLVKAPGLNCLALLEPDLMGSWIPMSTGTQKERLSLCSKTAHLVLKFPFPLWNRDLYVVGFGVDILEDGCVAVSLRSAVQGEQVLGQTLLGVTPPPSTVRMDCSNSGFLFEPISPEITRVTIMLCQDPKLDFVSPAILNFFTKQLGWISLTLFRKAAVNLNQAYKKKIEGDPQLYNLIRDRQRQYFEDQSKSALSREEAAAMLRDLDEEN